MEACRRWFPTDPYMSFNIIEKCIRFYIEGAGLRAGGLRFQGVRAAGEGAGGAFIRFRMVPR